MMKGFTHALTAYFADKGYNTQVDLYKRLKNDPACKHLAEHSLKNEISRLFAGRHANKNIVKGLRRIARYDPRLSDLLMQQYGEKVIPSKPIAVKQDMPVLSKRQQLYRTLNQSIVEEVNTYTTAVKNANSIDRLFLYEGLAKINRTYQSKGETYQRRT